MKRFCFPFSRLPLSWIAFGLGLIVFALTRVLPGSEWRLPADGQSKLDLAYVEQLRESLGSYSLLDEDHRQTYGPHVLPQYARAVLSRVTGDPNRAGIWLSLVGVFGVLSGVYALARRVLPLRGYCLICVVGLAGVGTTHYAVDPDPSIALGMGLVVWGFAFFTSSLVRNLPKRALVAAVFFGLAGYVRFELSLIQALLSIYLLGLLVFPTSPHRRGMPLGAMALGGLLVVTLLLWPLIHMNMVIAGSPILPGPDADVILGAPAGPNSYGPPLLRRFFSGFGMLMLDPAGPGIFAGLLWPLGMAISLVTGRQKSFPFFWLPMLILMVLTLTLMSFVTGQESYRESLRIITPILLPFSILPLVFPVFIWLQRRPRPEAYTCKIWLLTGLAVYFMLQAPHAVRVMLNRAPSRAERTSTEWLDVYPGLGPDMDPASVLTDSPADFLPFNAATVYGWGGETDWEVHTTKYADGTPRAEDLLAYLHKSSIDYVHVSTLDRQIPLEKIRLMVESGDIPEDPRTRQNERIVGFEHIKGVFPPPHSVYRVRYETADEAP